MPRKVVLLAVVIVLLAVTCAAAAEKTESERFVKILSSPLGDISFDTQSVKFCEEYDNETLIQVVEVEKKMMYSKFGVMSTIDKRKSANLPTKGFEELSYVLMRYQITLDKPRWRITQAVYYSEKGVKLDSYYPHGPKWEIVQDISDSRSSYAINSDVKMADFRVTISNDDPRKEKKEEFDRYITHNPREENDPGLNDSRPSYVKIMEYVKAHYYIPSPRK